MLAASWVFFMIRDADAPYLIYWRPLSYLLAPLILSAGAPYHICEFLCLMRALSDRLKLRVGAYRLKHERANSDGV